MIVPSFSGKAGENEDIGTTARSYLRQVSAWRRMTRMTEDQQGLTLYQHLTDKAWVDAERLDVDKLASRDGVEYLLEWIKDRYLDVEVTQIGRSLSGFFRGLHRKANQSVRDYMAEFDRAFARLGEVGCHLPGVAAAWVFVDRMGLEEQAELNLLASVGNQYSLKALQQAAIVHDRGLRKPWESGSRAPRKEWTTKRPFTANMAGINEEADYENDDGFILDEDSQDYVSEEMAENLYQAFMTHETAKAKYRESMKLRGSDPNSLKQLAADKLRSAKAKSFCAGCKRRGHWHRDAECPLNKGHNNGNAATSGSAPASTFKDPVKPSYPCHVVHVTWEISESSPPGLLAITDTACSRSVAGAGWIDLYLAEARRAGCEPMFINCSEAFRFGASKVFMASYGVILCFELGNKKVCLKVAVVNGEVPLLVSRLALGKMGMIMDVEYNRASFRSLGVTDMTLQITQTGHPAFSVQPACIPRSCLAASNWESAEIQILPLSGQYTEVTEGRLSSEQGSSVQMCDSCSLSCATSWMVSSEDVEDVQAGDGISDDRPQCSEPEFKPVFYPKKIGLAAKNLFLDEVFNPQTFASWWSTTKISNDFWVESEELLVRVHVIPRRSFFSPLHWRTTDFARKHSLLQSLGAVRTVHAISCKSFREFPVTHGTWDDESDDTCLPVLWVGRTLFRRRKQMPIPTSLPSTSRDGPQVGLADGTHGLPSEDVVGVHQGRAGGGSPSTQFVVSRELDGTGDQVLDPRGPTQPQRESSRGQWNEQDDRPAVEGTGYGARVPPPDVCHQGDDYEDPTRPTRHGSSEHPRLRQVQREDVQRDAGELQELGAEGGCVARQSFGRLGDVRELVARRASSMEGEPGSRSEIFGGDRLHRPRDECEDPLHRGRQLNDVMGHDLEGESRFSLPRSQGEEPALVHHASTPDTAEEKDNGEHRDGRGHSHGPGDSNGGGRRSEVLGGETGRAEGSAWDPSDPELNVTKEDAHEELYYDCEDPHNAEAIYNADGAEETQDFPLDYANCEDQEGGGDHGRSDDAAEEEQGDHDEINDYLGEFDCVYIDKEEESHGQDQDYHEANGYVYDMNHGGNGDVFQCQTSEVKRISILDQCEHLAKTKMKEKAFSFEDALEVARALPLRRLRRGKSVQRGGGSCFDYFVGGLYTYGPFVGMTKSAKGMPWTIKFFNSFVRSLGGGQWTSFVLFRNTATEKHTDNHNLSGTTIKTVTFGSFSGGELWVQGPVPQGENHQVAHRKGSDGEDIMGYLVDTREKLYQFSGKIPHATQPWEGERWTLSCYTTRGYPQSTIAIRDELRELRFPLRGVPLHVRGQDATWEVPDNPRPSKSTRKSLWKKAGRIAALTAWCTAAATAYVSDDFPTQRGRDAVALFEIGGYQKTLEITEIDYLVAEPFGYELDREVQWNPEVVHQTVRDLLPAVLWVHVPEATNLLPSILDYLYEQVDHGRQLVLEGPPEHPCWDTQAVKELFERYIQKWRRRRSEPHLLRVNDFTDYEYDREPKHEIIEFDNYMVRHRTGGEEGDKDAPRKVGAEAITFEGGAKIAPEVKSSLRRLHQNLGHPNNTDLARHLRLAGADPSVIEATKKIKCQVCYRNQRGQSSKLPSPTFSTSTKWSRSMPSTCTTPSGRKLS